MLPERQKIVGGRVIYIQIVAVFCEGDGFAVCDAGKFTFMYGILYRVESECLTAVEGLIYIDPALAAGVGELYICLLYTSICV